MRLDLGPVELGISIGVQEARLGGEECTLSVHVDGAAFEDHAGRVERQLSERGDVLRHSVIQIERWIFSPQAL